MWAWRYRRSRGTTSSSAAIEPGAGAHPHGEEPSAERFVDILPVMHGGERIGEIGLASVFEVDQGRPEAVPPHSHGAPDRLSSTAGHGIVIGLEQRGPGERRSGWR